MNDVVTLLFVLLIIGIIVYTIQGGKSNIQVQETEQEKFYKTMRYFVTIILIIIVAGILLKVFIVMGLLSL